MLTTLKDMEPKRAEAVLSNLMRALLPDASPRSQAQQFESLSFIERDILREVSERLGFADDLPATSEVPAVLDFLSRELSDVVLSKANVEELETRAFQRVPSARETTRRPRPRVFIASSSEGLEYAHALQTSLEPSANAVVWVDQTVVSSYGLEGLIRELGRFDFAVFLLTADDLSAFKGKAAANRSNNVLFEAGLFVGRLGVNRTFFVTPRGLPRQAFLSDLSGVLTLHYDPLAPSKDAALGSTSHQIAAQIQRFGPVGSKEAVNT